jgi:hypothetical protein
MQKLRRNPSLGNRHCHSRLFVMCVELASEERDCKKDHTYA